MYTLKGKLLIKGTIKLITGLHIGTSGDFSAIGAVDTIVIRDSVTNKPMIPGSSLKGKMRYLLARTKYHSSLELEDIKKEDICIKRLFGSSDPIMTSRLQFQDILLSNKSIEEFKEFEFDLPYTEIKYENTIDRTKGVANPRQLERVPAGSEFDFKLVYNVEKTDEFEEELNPNFAEEVGSIMEEYEVPRDVAISRLATSKLEEALQGTNIKISDFNFEQLEQIMSAIKEYDFYVNEITEIADPKLPVWKMEHLKWLIDDWNKGLDGVTSEKIRYLKELDIELAKFNVLKTYLINDEVSISQIEEFKDNIDFVTMSEFVDSLKDYAYNNQNEKVAVKVGNEFILASKQDSFDISLEDNYFT